MHKKRVFQFFSLLLVFTLLLLGIHLFFFRTLTGFVTILEEDEISKQEIFEARLFDYDFNGNTLNAAYFLTKGNIMGDDFLAEYELRDKSGRIIFEGSKEFVIGQEEQIEIVISIPLSKSELAGEFLLKTDFSGKDQKISTSYPIYLQESNLDNLINIKNFGKIFQVVLISLAISGAVFFFFRKWMIKRKNIRSLRKNIYAANYA